MSEWQPIETAPKDGQCCILLINGMAIEGLWAEDDAWDEENAGWVKRGGWQVISLPSHGCGCCSYDNDSPSHWMPVPEPPK